MGPGACQSSKFSLENAPQKPKVPLTPGLPIAPTPKGGGNSFKKKLPGTWISTQGGFTGQQLAGQVLQLQRLPQNTPHPMADVRGVLPGPHEGLPGEGAVLDFPPEAHGDEIPQPARTCRPVQMAEGRQIHLNARTLGRGGDARCRARWHGDVPHPIHVYMHMAAQLYALREGGA